MTRAFTWIAASMLIASTTASYAQSVYLPLEYDLSNRIGQQLNSLSSRAHTSLQPYEVSRLGLPASYDSVLTSGRGYTYEGTSWLERKLFSEHLLEVKTDEVQADV